MLKKMILVTLSALLLGGCTLGDVFRGDSAAKDEVIAPQSSPDAPDPALTTMPATSESTDTDSLELDINSTTIIEEDFSDLN